ncbi:MAG: FGGY family carbohydrate kinase [Thermoproteota archaeon]
MVSKPPYILSIDLGTSSCKTIIFTLDGKKVSSAYEEYTVIRPQPGWAEQDPSAWWKAVVKTIKGALKKGGVKGKEIIGLAVASQREAVVPVRGEQVLYNAIIWLDNRTLPQVEHIRDTFDPKEILSITGLNISPVFSASKILWLKDNAPECFKKTEYFLFPKDYIIFKLTGERVTDYSMASRTMLFDIRKKQWSDEICSAFGIDLDKLPPVKESHAVVGEISSKASKETSLPPGIPVVNGGGDRPCECFGAGVIDEGFVNIGTGTGTSFEVPLWEPRPDEKGRVNCCCHVIPNLWEYEFSISTTGAILRWFRDVFGYEEISKAKKTGRDPYDFLIRDASKLEPGAGGLLFYPNPTSMFSTSPENRDYAVFFRVTLSHSKSHFVRSILEGISFKYLKVLELLKELNINVSEMRMVGGETKSDFWNQLKADVIGMRIRIPQVEDSAAMGAALLAGIGIGQYPSIKKAVESTVRIKKTYEPNMLNHSIYMALYKNYEEIHNFLSAII